MYFGVDGVRVLSPPNPEVDESSLHFLCDRNRLHRGNTGHELRCSRPQPLIRGHANNSTDVRTAITIVRPDKRLDHCCAC